MGRSSYGIARVVVPVLALLAVVGATVAALAASGFAVRHSCVPGALGFLGADVSLMYRSACPAPSVAVAPHVMVTAIALVTVPAIVIQVLLLVALMCVPAVAGWCAGQVGVILAVVRSGMRPRTGTQAVALVMPRVPGVPRAQRPVPLLRSRLLADTRIVRGPPVGMCAV